MGDAGKRDEGVGFVALLAGCFHTMSVTVAALWALELDGTLLLGIHLLVNGEWSMLLSG